MTLTPSAARRRWWTRSTPSARGSERSQRWLAWGRAVLALQAGDRVDVATLPEGRLPHKAVRFAETVEHVLAQDEANRLSRITQAAIGGAVVGRRIVETRHKVGRVSTVTDERLAPQPGKPTPGSSSAAGASGGAG